MSEYVDRSPANARRIAYIIVIALLVARSVASVWSNAGMNWDFTNFYNTGLRVYLGEWDNIYRSDTLIGGRPRELAQPFDYVGFPLSALAFAPLGAFSPRVALIVFKAFCLVCYALGFWLLYRHFTERSRDDRGLHPQLLLYLGVILVFEPVWKAFTIGGQATALTFLLVVLFLDWLVRGNDRLAAAALSVAILFKPFLAPMGLILLVGRQFRVVAWLGAFLLLEGLASVILMGPALHREWLELLAQHSGRWATGWEYNASIANFFSNFWLIPRPADTRNMPADLKLILQPLRVAVVLCMMWLTWRTSRGPLPPAEKRHWIAVYAISLALFFPMIVWEHYLVLLFPALLFMVFRFRELTTGQRLLLVGALAATLRANHWIAVAVTRQYMVPNSLPEEAFLSVFGSGTLILALLLWLWYQPRPIRTT